MKILDVGSGIPYPGLTTLTGKNVIHVDIDRRAFHLEVICDIRFLPFINDYFYAVNASHILEHIASDIETLNKSLTELKRVSFKVVIIKVPNARFKRFGERSNNHLVSWTSHTLSNFLKRHFKNVEVSNTFKLKTNLKGMRKKIQTLKVLCLCFLSEPNELTAICTGVK